MQLVRWLGAKIVEGFFILLPLLIAYLMLGQMFDALMALTLPVLDLLPRAVAVSEDAHKFFAAAILVLLFLGAGVVASSLIARRIGGWIERRFLEKFPPYTVIRTLSAQLSGRDPMGELQPALLSVSAGVETFVVVVEELDDGRLTVFVPFAPTPAVGQLQIVDPARVERLDASMATAAGWLMNWGTGTDALFPGRPGPTAAGR